MSEFAANLERSALGRRFGFQERGTSVARDTVAGMTTFIVMSYIIFVNSAILGFAGVEDLQEQGLPFDAVLTSTCLVAGVPFAFSITDGIAAGFIVYVLVRVFQGAWATVHPLMWAAAVAFAIYLAIPIMQQEFSWI